MIVYLVFYALGGTRVALIDIFIYDFRCKSVKIESP
jgi:hypothetical protein